MYTFNVEKTTRDCIKWIQEWFDANGKGCNAIVGISGGKDSSIVAALCVAALGKERVLGVLMPQGEQFDINYSLMLCEHLGIKYHVINIKDSVDAVYKSMNGLFEVTNQTKFNLPARIRMTTLYAVSQSNNGRVANTCNLSEDWVGYSTKYGDAAGDFSPLSKLTVTEVKQMGTYLGLPDCLVHKPPIDGLCGKTDEDNLGFTYEELDKYIREGIEPTKEKKDRIDYLHRINLFKLQLMPTFPYENK